MTTRLIAVGDRQPRWVVEAYEEYAKRLPRQFAIQLTEIPPQNRKTAHAEKIRQLEGERILQAIRSSDRVVALDEKGKSCSTLEFAEMLSRWQDAGSDLCLLIGGADGLHDECKARADATLSLSQMTLPHGLVRVLIAEQLYRAWSIMNGHPYHRG
ncbi:MAG: 23S rRNA (pseudouridine(1915)-N(3))-methyltransferase RlmH [Proteobacteria bacterium]|nr:23S rRNA (pseudouridine(1915)-N(3))-methyltransferase RlmH [Pseudomonadota bacterium]